MYKLLVVDDEYYIRKGLSQTVNWNALNIEVVAEATNGVDAVNLTRQFEPDIVITDINMPQLSGLDYIQAVKSSFPKIKIVIISGYAEFQYAQRAIDMDVCAYLLKPLEEEEIITTFSSIVRELDQEKQLSKKLIFLEQEFSGKLELMKKSFALDVAAGFYSRPQEMEAALQAAQMTLAPDYCSAVFWLKQQAQDRIEDHRTQLMMTLSLEQTLHDLLAEEFDVLEAIQRPGKIISLIGLRGESTKAQRELLRKMLEKLSALVTETFHTDLYIGIGRRYQSLAGLYLSCNEAQIALSYRATFQEEHVIWYESVAEISHLTYTYPSAEERYIIRCIEQANSEAVPQAVRAFTQELVRQKQPEQAIQVAIQTLVQTLARNSAELGMDANQLGRFPCVGEAQDAANLDTIEQIDQWLIEKIGNAACAFEATQQSNLLDVMRKAKEYIKRNFTNPDLTIASIAEHLYISPNYFSSLFAKEYNESCSAYITRLRMEEAKRLLRQTNMRISDIGAASGYENAQYFATLFKKNTGKTPAEYRNYQSHRSSHESSNSDD